MPSEQHFWYVMSQNSRLVYSTDSGRIKESKQQAVESKTDGIIRVQRETKGRGGKAVCVITGIPSEKLKQSCKLLKSRCATGGAVKGSSIEIQGDHREKIKTLLEAEGYSVKLAGG